jgi:hypothetical protein
MKNIWEQVDLACGCGRDKCRQRYRFSWMIALPYAMRREMIAMGWKWISGRPTGVFVTNDPAAVDRLRDSRPGIGPIASNGSHERMGAPTHAVQQARDAVRREYLLTGLDADEEIEGFADMDADQLRDEITYLADYQG